MIYHQLWYIGREPFLGPLSFLCPIEKIWRIDCHNFPTKGTNKINIFVLIIVKTDYSSKGRKLLLTFCRKGNISLHCTSPFIEHPVTNLTWTARREATRTKIERQPILLLAQKCPSAQKCPKLPKCSLRRRCSGCSLVAGGQLATGALPPSSNPLTFPPSSLSLTNSWFSTWQPTSHPTPGMK